jgi:hypothetical protein
MSTTRQRKLKFLKDMRGFYGLQDAVQDAIREHGQHWLTDEQLQDLVSMEARRTRSNQHFNMRNRARRAAQ